MARRYSRKRGKSGSKKPVKKIVPGWVRYGAKEVELLITKLAKEGNTKSMIGLVLRDSYGIPDVKTLTGKSIGDILTEKNLQKEIPEDLMALMKKNINERKHIENNHKDMVAGRGLQLTEAKIKALIKYYQRTGVIGEDWKYDPEKVKLLIE